MNSKITKLKVDQNLEVKKLIIEKIRLESTNEKCENEKSEQKEIETKLNSDLTKLENDQKLDNEKRRLESTNENCENEKSEQKKKLNLELVSLKNVIQICENNNRNILHDCEIAKNRNNVSETNVKIEKTNLKRDKEISETEIELNNKRNFNLTCKFSIIKFYICNANDLRINYANSEIYQVFGQHFDFKTNSDVTQLIIKNSKILNLPNNIFKTFHNLQTVQFQKINLKYLSRGDFVGGSKLIILIVNENSIKSLDDNIFEGAEQLELLFMESNKIEKLSSNTFENLRTLKKLSLRNNLIKELHVELFKNLVNLEILIVSSNQLKFLDGKLLQFNNKLTELSFDNNYLEEIGEDILKYSTGLKKVNFYGNKCLNRNFLIQFNVDYLVSVITKNCKKNKEHFVSFRN